MSSANAAVVAPPNPNPRYFVIMDLEQVGAHVIAGVFYPHCTTYEGRKTLLFASTNVKTVLRSPVIDPHFSEDTIPGVLTPVARFEPTARGWRLARIAASAL